MELNQFCIHEEVSVGTMKLWIVLISNDQPGQARLGQAHIYVDSRQLDQLSSDWLGVSSPGL